MFVGLTVALPCVQAYLNSDALSRFPEIELYEAVQTWLRHDRRRWRHTDTIVQSIRFCLMTPANIFEKVGFPPSPPPAPLRSAPLRPRF